MRWELVIDEMETKLCVGICEHEQNKPQRLLVSAHILADYPARPASIDECLNYDLLHDLVVNQWPNRPQTELVETLVMELFEFIFNASKMVQEAEIHIAKPDILDAVKAVGVRATLTRAQFEAL